MKSPLFLSLFSILLVSGLRITAQQDGGAHSYIEFLKSGAASGDAEAQCALGNRYLHGDGVVKNHMEAVKWFLKAADQGNAESQRALARCFGLGIGVTKDPREAARWQLKAAEQGLAEAQHSLGTIYCNGAGVPIDYVEGHKWLNLASAQGNQKAKEYLKNLERRMTAHQIAEAQRLAREFVPHRAPLKATSPDTVTVPPAPITSGTGFMITDDGFFISSEHLVRNGIRILIVTSAGPIPARVVRVDKLNDLVLLKAEGRFAALPVIASRGMRLGATVATVGFPNIGLQGFAPKLAKGEVASLTGAQDDPKYFQISAPLQPGNSGGALVDERGNVVGVVAAKLNAVASLAATGTLPENVNYAVKSSFLLGFLESMPEVRLKEPNVKDRKFEDVVKEAEQAAVLVLVY